MRHKDSSKKRLHPQKVAKAVGQELTVTRLQKITLSDKIKKIFPNSRRIIDTIEEEASSSFSEDFADETDVQLTIKELNNGELPFELNFFGGDEEDKNLLIDDLAVAQCITGNQGN